MLEDKRKDLDAERRKVLLQRLVSELSQESPDVYYLPTAQIAMMIHADVQTGRGLNGEERALLGPLSARDIEVILSLR